MSGLSGTNDQTIGSDNIEKVAGTTGLVGYTNTYISLQAVNGIFINGIGSGNTANTELPFSNKADANGYISGVTNGDFWISGQNGGAVIKSCNRTTPGPNGEGIGSIHINSANGDVVINVPNGNFESNVAMDTVNNNQGNVTNNTKGNQTNNTTGNQVNNTTGNQESYTYGNQYAWAKGNQTQITLDSINTIALGALNQFVLGLCTQTAIGEQVNFNGGGLQNLVLGDILDFYIGAHNTVTLGFITESHPVGKASATDLKLEAIQAKIKQHSLDISSTNTQIRSMLVHLNDAGIHLYT